MKKFKVFITEENGNTLHVDNGVVVSNAARKPLPNNPDGWQSISIGWERNLSLYGVVRNFTLALGFVRDAAKILRKVFYTENIERKLSLLITMLNLTLTNTTFAFNYFFLYKGDLDLSTFTDEPNKVTMNIMEGGISKLLKANSATLYDIPLDDPDAIDVHCDGILLFNRVHYAMYEFTETGSGFEGGKDLGVMPILLTSEEGKGSGLIFLSSSPQLISNVGTDDVGFMNGSENWIIRNDGPTPITFPISGQIDLRCLLNNDGGPAGFSGLFLYLKCSRSLTAYTIYNAGVLADTNYSLPFSFTITLLPGEKLFPFRVFNEINPGQRVIIIQYQETSFIITEPITRFAPTTIKMFSLADFFKKLTGKLTGNELDAVSTLLAAHENICITCGDAIRGFATAKIKTKMDDFFKSVNVQLNIGMGIEGNKLTLEQKAHYFDSSNPVALGEVKSLKTTLATDLMFNSLKIGAPPKDYQDINGRQEFNNTTLYGTPVTRVVKEFDLSSPYRRDCYGFEYTRINFDGKLTTDSSNDNDVWLVNIDRSVTPIVVKRGVYDTITGLLTPESVFNIEEMTNARLMQIHGNWIHSLMWGFESSKMPFLTTDKNRELKTVQGSVIYDEDADIIVSDLAAPLFIPLYFEIEVKVPVNLPTLLENNPAKCFSFTWEGNLYKGFLMKAGISIADNAVQVFKLLSTPDNDLTKLVV